MLILRRLLFVVDCLPKLTETATLYSLRYSKKSLTVEFEIKVPPMLRSVE